MNFHSHPYNKCITHDVTVKSKAKQQIISSHQEIILHSFGSTRVFILVKKKNVVSKQRSAQKELIIAFGWFLKKNKTALARKN